MISDLDLTKIFAILFKDTNLFEFYEFLDFDSDKMRKFMAIFMHEDKQGIFKIPSKKDFNNALRCDVIYDNLKDMNDEEKNEAISELAKIFKTNKSMVKQQFKKMEKIMNDEETIEILEKLEKIYKI